MDCDEPHLTPNENMQPIQWTERPTGALVAAGSLWPLSSLAPELPSSIRMHGLSLWTMK